MVIIRIVNIGINWTFLSSNMNVNPRKALISQTAGVGHGVGAEENKSGQQLLSPSKS